MNRPKAGPDALGNTREPGQKALKQPTDPEQRARDIALRRLTRAPQTRTQLAEAITRQGVAREVADAVLDRFEEVGLVDDAAYAAMFVRTRHAERGLVGRALTQELRRKGVPDLVASAARDQLSPADIAQRARQLAERKLASCRTAPRPVRLRRTLALLTRKGYPIDLAQQAIRAALAAESDDLESAVAPDRPALVSVH